MMGKYFTKKPFAYKPKGFISSYELQELIKEISILSLKYLHRQLKRFTDSFWSFH